MFNLESKVVVKLYFKYHDVINCEVLNLFCIVSKRMGDQTVVYNYVICWLCAFIFQGHDLSADCWSLGILIFELLTGRLVISVTFTATYIKNSVKARWSTSVDPQSNTKVKHDKIYPYPLLFVKLATSDKYNIFIGIIENFNHNHFFRFEEVS